MPRRRRQDGRMRRATAASGAAAPAVEDRQLDAPSRSKRGQRLLRAVDLPLRRHVAAVLARVRIADHHLDPALPRDTRIVEQLADDRRCRA